MADEAGKEAFPSRCPSSDTSPAKGQAEMHEAIWKASELHLEPVLLFAESRQPRSLAVSSLSPASACSDIQKVREGRGDACCFLSSQGMGAHGCIHTPSLRKAAAGSLPIPPPLDKTPHKSLSHARGLCVAFSHLGSKHLTSPSRK